MFCVGISSPNSRDVLKDSTAEKYSDSSSETSSNCNVLSRGDLISGQRALSITSKGASRVGRSFSKCFSGVGNCSSWHSHILKSFAIYGISKKSSNEPRRI